MAEMDAKTGAPLSAIAGVRELFRERGLVEEPFLIDYSVMTPTGLYLYAARDARDHRDWLTTSSE